MPMELSRAVAVSKIGRAGLAVEVLASPEECAAVAARMDIPAILSLACRFELKIENSGVSVLAVGHLRAEVTRVCVASAEDFDMLVEEQFIIRCVPAGTEREDPDPDLPDEIPYAGGIIDLGEAAAEQLGLALDPYPRLADADGSLIEDPDEVSPFADLARHLMSGQTKQ